MILSDFVLTDTKGTALVDRMYFGEVTVTTETGHLWWKKKVVERRAIAKEFGSAWFFTDDGKRCPYTEIEDLERAARARGMLTGKK